MRTIPEIYSYWVHKNKENHPSLTDEEYDYLNRFANFEMYLDDFESYDIDLKCLDVFTDEDFNEMLDELPSGFYSHQGYAPSVCLIEPRFKFS